MPSNTSIASSGMIKCEKCNGSGLYIFEQDISEYEHQNGLAHIYGDRTFTTWVGKKCPYCNGGFTSAVTTAKKFSGIPEVLYNKRYSDFDWSVYVDGDGNIIKTGAAQKIIRSFIDDFDTWEKKQIGLYIYCDTKGAGKTFLSSCICNELMQTRAMRTRFVNASDLIELSQSGDRNAVEPEKRNPIKLLNECKLLVIDDLGQKNFGNDWLEDIVYKLLDERMSRGRVTIITSNYNIDSLPFDERLTDRINKICYPVKLPDVSVRSNVANTERTELLKELGLTKEKKE